MLLPAVHKDDHCLRLLTREIDKRKKIESDSTHTDLIMFDFRLYIPAGIRLLKQPPD